MRVAFRVDASTEIGSGHLMRCLTLADSLRDQGAETVFLCRDLPGFPGELLASSVHSLEMLPATYRGEENEGDSGGPVHARWLGVGWQTDADQVSMVLESGGGTDWLVVDHYGLDERWEQKIGSTAERVMVIDDLADRAHDCDLLLDQTLAANESVYLPLLPEGCTLLLGPQYALLRPQFAAVRLEAVRRRLQTKGVRGILVAMGGMDPEGVTGKALQGIRDMSGLENVTVVLGAKAPHLADVKSFDAAFGYRVLSGVADMARLMVAHDLGIGCGGMTSWERCVVGLPAVLLAGAENQVLIGRALQEAGAGLFLGYASQVEPLDICAAAERLGTDRTLYHSMVEAGLRVCDGMGTERVASVLWGQRP